MCFSQLNENIVVSDEDLFFCIEHKTAKPWLKHLFEFIIVNILRRQTKHNVKELINLFNQFEKHLNKDINVIVSYIET